MEFGDIIRVVGVIVAVIIVVEGARTIFNKRVK